MGSKLVFGFGPSSGLYFRVRPGFGPELVGPFTTLAGMKVSTTETLLLHLSINPDQCSLQVNAATLKQIEKFKYLGVAFTSDGRQDEELDTRIDKARAVMRALHHSVVMKRELSIKAKLSIFKKVFALILIYGHELLVMTERVQSQVQASEIRFLR